VSYPGCATLSVRFARGPRTPQGGEGGKGGSRYQVPKSLNLEFLVLVQVQIFSSAVSQGYSTQGPPAAPTSKFKGARGPRCYGDQGAGRARWQSTD
jgi:hypothetical protein